MSVIARMEATPSRVRLLVSVLADRPSGETVERLRAFCSPETLHRAAQDPIAIFRATLTAAKDLGLIETLDDKLRVREGVLTRKGNVSTDVFAAIERALLTPEAEPDRGQIDFARAVAWFLMQSPKRPLQQSINYKLEIQKQMALPEEMVFDLTSRDRFNSFHYWCRFLGYGEVVAGRALIADPTSALRRHLPQAMEGDRKTPIRSLLGRLAKQTPVFEGGRVRREVESDARPEYQREAQRLSASTSFALYRLEQEGVLKLAADPDAQPMILDLGADAPRRVSHVELAGSQA